MRKLRQINLNNILFLDIETVPMWQKFEDAPENVKKEWIYKFKFRPGAPAELDFTGTDEMYWDQMQLEYEGYFSEIWKKEAGIYPEFSKIICISFGFMNAENFRIKSVSTEIGQPESGLLSDFCDIINSFYSRNPQLILCAHNGMNFDFPFIVKRLMLHRIEIPIVLDTYGLKPWEINSLLDTLAVWKLMSYSQGASLPSIAMHFGLPSPKNDIEGKDVCRVYYAGDTKRIVIYCEKDVVSMASCFKCMRGEEPIKEGQVQNVM